MSKRILLADDEPAVREAIAMLLMIDGHTVIQVGGGKEALSRLEKEPFDLVITDYQMEGMKGDELATTIKRRSPSQRVMMITAHDAPTAGPDNPVDAILNKPFSLEELRRSVGRVLG